MNWLQREREAWRSIRGTGEPFPPPGTAVEGLYWTWHNLRVWWANIVHPLTEEQKRANEDELLKGGKDGN